MYGKLVASAGPSFASMIAMKRFYQFSLVCLGFLLVPTSTLRAEDDVNVSGFFDKDKVSEGMVGGSFAERKPPAKRPSTVSDRSTNRRQLEQEDQQQKQRGKAENQGRYGNNDAVTPQISNAPIPSEFGAIRQVPQQPATAGDQEVNDWSRQMKEKLNDFQEGANGSSPSNRQYYDQILRKLDSMQTPNSHEEGKGDESTRF